MLPFDLIYSDDELLVVDKHPGVVVTPSETQVEKTLADALKDTCGIDLDRAGIVHRLDKDTSGLLLVAKTQLALENLQAQFKQRTVKKEYICLVHGDLAKEQTVNAPIARNPGDREKFVVVETSEAREATTRFVPLQALTFRPEIKDKIFEEFNKIQKRKLERSKYGLFTLVRCFPFTGRTHQIRVHLKHINFPIVGDEKYGGRKTSRLDKRWCPRQFLHAARIEFDHPSSGKRISFEGPLPEDLEKVLSKLAII